jgi:hypothetical protein
MNESERRKRHPGFKWHSYSYRLALIVSELSIHCLYCFLFQCLCCILHSASHSSVVTSYQLPATSYQLPATSYQLPATSYQLPSCLYICSRWFSLASFQTRSGASQSGMYLLLLILLDFDAAAALFPVCFCLCPSIPMRSLPNATHVTTGKHGNE